ncbi:carbonic anhydrase-related protein 10 [Nephila pilipes]|uniref:Carbonic anhydrase-related protein 10 n=1 Tax=Nephila pilipes TaxID=299642 RepID=A0A8X6NYZ8_NEPPI|nr:carbonic anhydrase-related protein 10 [Nephila pilipes]
MVSGILTNTGHSVAFRVSDVQPGVPINISGGPLSYKYRFHELHLHYGRTDDRGSEHTVSGTSFPGEQPAAKTRKLTAMKFGSTWDCTSETLKEFLKKKFKIVC